MDKLRGLETFVRIVEGGSLTAAAEALQTSLPSVVRTLAALEALVGVRLLNRTTRRLSLTDEGQVYYERCKRVLEEIDAAEAALTARRTTPRGRLRITAPVMFGRLRVAPVVLDFLAQHAEIEVELLLFDRIVDLVEEGVDAALRIAHLPDSSLVAMPVGETRRIVCAAPDYLRRAGTPATPRDLAQHRCIAFSGLEHAHEWVFAGGAAERVALRPVLTTNSVDAAIDACVHGAGCGRFLCYQVQSLLDSGRLTRLLTGFEPAPVPIHLVYPHARLLSANVRAFIDFAAPRLKQRA